MSEIKKEKSDQTSKDTKQEAPVRDEKEKKSEKKEEKKESEKNKVAELEEQINAQKLVIADLNKKVETYKNEYAKAYADADNIRKRLTKEKDDFMKYHIQNFAKDILPVLDNCERALAADTKDEALHKGVQMIYDQLKAALAREGVTEIDALNKPFDGNWHQALMSEKKDGVEPGIVIEVLQKGYKLKDRILRAALVKVSE